MNIPARSITLTLLTLTLLAGCEFFDDVHDDGSADETSTTGEPEPEPEPSEGFRVFPMYLLQDVPAVVTIERNAVPVVCPLDDIDGGYLCDATGAPAGTLTVVVERDGFDTAIRHPTLVPEVIDSLEVHLSPTGGPTGMWSSCVTAGAFETCGDVCSNEMLGCAVASCATADTEWPIGTLQTYEDPDCIAPFESAALSCSVAIPAGPAASLRCCCSAP